MIRPLRFLAQTAWVCLAGAVAAAPETLPIVAQRAEQAYQSARVRYNRAPTNAEAAWQFGRACFDQADAIKHDAQRESVADEGVRACRQALIDDPKSAWAHYYLGLNLGEMASARGLGALRLLHEMEDEWQTAIRLDETIDYAGPNRSLGLLYRDAPGFPLSLGNHGKAIQCLTRAVALSPGYPENQLALAEAYLKWNEYNQARRIAVKIPEVFKQARKDFSGPAWVGSWIDWSGRWDAVESRLHEISRPQSPHSAR
ncbi:MAG TPA: tetratricopeptide repeat protein [Verrucomicrobiae bacterium]|jgi:tetratricopeptide (TPR) repeat protein|nr:tetratricopeptide repeat protein [Verrucomicrobiae bacterium]